MTDLVGQTIGHDRILEKPVGGGMVVFPCRTKVGDTADSLCDGTFFQKRLLTDVDNMQPLQMRRPGFQGNVQTAILFSDVQVSLGKEHGTHSR